MGIETGEVVLEVDSAPVEDAVITIDPVELTPVVIIDPMPVEDFPVAFDDFKSVDDSTGDPVADGSTGEDVPADDSLLFTTTVVDGSGGEDVPADDSLLFTTTFVDAPVDEVPVDEVPVDEVVADGGSEVIAVGVSGDVPDDGTVSITDETGEIIDRPVDPMPEWRTLVVEGGGEVVGSEGGSVEEVPVLDKEVIEDTGIIDDTGIIEDTGITEGTDPDGDVIYTLDPSDPLIYANTASGEVPGRSIDPLPYERTNSAPAADLTAPDTASDVVHYAAAEPFHTGLDLL